MKKKVSILQLVNSHVNTKPGSNSGLASHFPRMERADNRHHIELALARIVNAHPETQLIVTASGGSSTTYHTGHNVQNGEIITTYTAIYDDDGKNVDWMDFRTPDQRRANDSRWRHDHGMDL